MCGYVFSRTPPLFNNGTVNLGKCACDLGEEWLTLHADSKANVRKNDEEKVGDALERPLVDRDSAHLVRGR